MTKKEHTTKFGNVSPQISCPSHEHTPNYGDSITIKRTGFEIGVMNTPHCHEISEQVSGPPISASVNDIAKSVNDEITRQVDNRVRDVMEEGGKDEWIAWFQAEVEHWKQRCTELEIELECMINAFPEHDHDVQPKRRGNF